MNASLIFMVMEPQSWLCFASQQIFILNEHDEYEGNT